MRDRSGPRMWRFRKAVQEAGLKDLGYTGGDFTWYNGRQGTTGVWGRLDQFLGNQAWQEKFPRAGVFHGSSSYSNHVPIWMRLSGRLATRR